MRIVADSHVHIHPSYSLTQVLDSATRHFRSVPMGQLSIKTLFLTEMAGVQRFESFEPGKTASSTANWRTSPTADAQAVRVSNSGGDEVYLIAGRQIVTAERIEVLALGVRDELPDGETLADTVAMVRDREGMAVLPWGFGKWTGRRKVVLTDYIRTVNRGDIYLGDIRARPRLFKEPGLFDLARVRGINILQGTDPLPFPSEALRIGSYGFWCDGEVDVERPWQSLYRTMTSPSFTPHAFGARQHPLPFMAGQLRLRLQKPTVAAS